MEFKAKEFNQIASKIIKNLEILGSKEVLIGIPGGDKHKGDGQPVDNADLGYWHEFGVPDHNLPARPFLIPGVINASTKVVQILEKAVLQATDVKKPTPNTEQVLNQCGMIAVSEVRKKWDNNNWAPLAISTIKKRIAKTGKGGNKKWKAAKAEFEATGDISGVIGLIQPLIDTGALRQSITYVIEERGNVDAIT